MMQFSALEMGILLGVAGLALLLNILASIRCVRALQRFGLPYLILIWLVPLLGALYVFAKVRPRPQTAFMPITTPTQGLDPGTIQGDPWPTLSQPLPQHRRRR